MQIPPKRKPPPQFDVCPLEEQIANGDASLFDRQWCNSSLWQFASAPRFPFRGALFLPHNKGRACAGRSSCAVFAKVPGLAGRVENHSRDQSIKLPGIGTW